MLPNAVAGCENMEKSWVGKDLPTVKGRESGYGSIAALRRPGPMGLSPIAAVRGTVSQVGIARNQEGTQTSVGLLAFSVANPSSDPVRG